MWSPLQCLPHSIFFPQRRNISREFNQLCMVLFSDADSNFLLHFYHEEPSHARLEHKAPEKKRKRKRRKAQPIGYPISISSIAAVLNVAILCKLHQTCINESRRIPGQRCTEINMKRRFQLDRPKGNNSMWSVGRGQQYESWVCGYGKGIVIR
jgi:hypothetical protein